MFIDIRRIYSPLCARRNRRILRGWRGSRVLATRSESRSRARRRDAEELGGVSGGEAAGGEEDADDGGMKATAMPMARRGASHSRLCDWLAAVATKHLTRQKRNSAPKDMVAGGFGESRRSTFGAHSKAETTITRPTATSARPSPRWRRPLPKRREELQRSQDDESSRAGCGSRFKARVLRETGVECRGEARPDENRGASLQRSHRSWTGSV